MPQCQAFGCSNIRGSVNEKGEKISFFAIPDPDKSKENYELCKMWIRAIGTDKFEHKKYKYHRDRVVCEEHFMSDCFMDDMQARLMGTQPKKRLKPGSVPTLFSFRPTEPKGPSRTELRIQSKERQEMLESLVPSKRPKKGINVKKTPLDATCTEIPEAEIIVGALQEIAYDTHGRPDAELGETRRVVRNSTCFVRDIGIQVTPSMGTSSSQTSSDSVALPGPDHDYIGSILESFASAPNADVEGKPADIVQATELPRSDNSPSPTSPPMIQRHVLDLPSLLGQEREPNTFLKVLPGVVRSPPIASTSLKPSPSVASITTSPSISGSSAITWSSSPSLPARSPLYLPSEAEEREEESSSDMSEEGFHGREDKLIRQKKFIVFEQCLDDLVGKVRCNKCLTPAVEAKKMIKGTAISLRLTCMNGHEIVTWHSQPFLKNTPCGNVLLAAAILYSGCSFSQIEQCLKFVGVQCIGKSMFYETLRNTLIPVVNHTYLQCQKEVVKQLHGKSVWLSGDGRCDSPGYNAKYCSYSLMDSNTKQIIHTELVQVTDTTSSVAMEKMGFQKCIDNIRSNGVKVSLVATDRHAGIRKLIRTEYPDIIHNFDVWHFVKSIRKKLLSKAKKKDHNALMQWIQSVCHHLWWCCQNCGQDPQMLREMWTSVLKHVVNIHSWVDGEKFHQCEHPPLSADEIRLKCWMKPGSPSHIALQDVVLNKTILKDLEHLVYSCHTGALEVFHSSLLKFCPKRLEFSYQHMQARMHLAVLDHNWNVNRKHATVKRGTKTTGAVGDERFAMVYSKAQGRWVAKKLYEAKTYEYAEQLMMDSIRGFEGRIQFEVVEDIARPQNIGKEAMPDKSVLVSSLKSRFIAPAPSVLPDELINSEENTEESLESEND